MKQKIRLFAGCSLVWFGAFSFISLFLAASLGLWLNPGWGTISALLSTSHRLFFLLSLAEIATGIYLLWRICKTANNE